MSNGATPPGFPSDIHVQQETFENWSLGINVPNLWTCQPNNPNDVVRVCNWAVGAGYQVRPRAVMHGWSPLTVVEGQSPANVILVDTTLKLNTVLSVTPASGGQPAQVKVQTGTTMDTLMAALETGVGGQGYSFAHIPAPGTITIGGALAIDAHGSAVSTPPNDAFNIPYGSLSNQILAFTAVVTDPASATPTAYVAKTFLRGDSDAKAFLTHIGRAFLLDVTLQVVENYNLRCQSFMNIPNTTLFASSGAGNPPPPQSAGDFLNQSGRIEIIWFPSYPFLGFPVTSYPWLKVWTVSPEKPASSRAVTSAYNYPFSDNLPPEVTAFFKSLASGGAAILTPIITATMASFTSAALNGGWGFQNATDLWGPSKNTMIYVADKTLRVTANGYAIRMPRAQVQQAVADFTSQFAAMLASYQGNGLYPINSPLEIRVTGLDDPSKIVLPAGQTAQSPVISALTFDPLTDDPADVAVWFDVLTVVPDGDPQHANEFYEDLENWVSQHFASYRITAEWSKGWAYTAASGPWTNLPYIETIRQTFGTGWAYEVDTLAKYDASKLFFNPFLTTLMTT